MNKNPSKCKVCKCQYTKTRSFQKVCGPECAQVHARELSANKQAKEKAVERKVVREKLDAMRTKPQLVKIAQTAFNAFVRARDADKPCISCGKPASDESNGWDAGHYRSVGSAPHLRFVEENCQKQCKHCNKYLAGNYVAYRQGLINRIGLAEVERIEADQTLRKYTKEGLLEIARHYKAEAKKLKT